MKFINTENYIYQYKGNVNPAEINDKALILVVSMVPAIIFVTFISFEIEQGLYYCAVVIA